MSKTLDLRIQKTYLGLIKSFVDLIETKCFEDITVNELCDNAMVRRATFYKHFADKYEFFTFYIRSLQEDFNKKYKHNEKSLLAHEHHINGIQYLFDFLSANEKLVNTISQSNSLHILFDILSKEMAFELQTILEKHEKPSIKTKIIAQLLAGSLVYTAKWWLKQENKIPKEQLIEQIILWLPKI